MVIGRIVIPSKAFRWYTITFPWMDATKGEKPLTHVYDVIAESNAADVADPSFNVIDKRFGGGKPQVSFLAGGGIDGTSYVVHAHVTSTDQQQSVDCIVFEIDDGGC